MWGIDRRIGRRVHLRGVGVHWSIPNAKRRFGKAPKPRVGELVELSMVGAALLTARTDDLALGLRIRLDLGETSLAAEVRHVQLLADPSLAVYGVRFLESSERLAQIMDPLLGPAGGGFATSWENSRSAELGLTRRDDRR